MLPVASRRSCALLARRGLCTPTNKRTSNFPSLKECVAGLKTLESKTSKAWNSMKQNARSSAVQFIAPRLTDEERTVLLSEANGAVMVETKNDSPELVLETTDKPVLEGKTHPVFGELLLDFGYKQVYASCPLAIRKNVPVWEQQRVFRSERAEEIAEALAGAGFGMPGVITVFENNQGGEGEKLRGVVDGQHRLGGLEIMHTAGKWPVGQRVLIEVYPTDSNDTVSDLFTQINQAEPVKLVDMPDALADEEAAAEAEQEKELQEQTQRAQAAAAAKQAELEAATAAAAAAAASAVAAESAAVAAAADGGGDASPVAAAAAAETAAAEATAAATAKAAVEEAEAAAAAAAAEAAAEEEAGKKVAKATARRRAAAVAEAAATREAINGAVERLSQQYPLMFKPSSRCRVPYLHVDNLRDVLFRSGVVTILLQQEQQKQQQQQQQDAGGKKKRRKVVKLTAPEREAVVVEWLEGQNEELEKMYAGGQLKTRAKKALGVSTEARFFLGMDSSMAWLSEFVGAAEEDQEDKDA